MTSFARALLILNVGWCLLAVAEDRLPGWHMFEDVERFEPSLRDREGQPVELREHLPKNAWLVRYDELTEVVRFVCETHRDRAPFHFDEPVRDVHVDLGPEECRVPRGPRAAR